MSTSSGGTPALPPVNGRNATREIATARADSRTTVVHLDTERGWRGGERQALWLAGALDRTRYRSIVAARGDGVLAARAAASGLPVADLRPAFEFDPWAVWRLRTLLRRESVDVVHAHTGHAVALAALATCRTSIAVVVTRRVDFPLRRRFATRWKYGRADGLIAISHAVADVLVASGIPASHIDVIPSGIDLTRHIVPASRDVLAALGVPPEAPLVVQVSQLVGHKDPLTFVEAVAIARGHLPALRALLVGDGPLRPAVSAAVHRLGLDGVLHLPGYRTDADALLAAADLVTLSSREEGLGTVLLDALSLGKPIVATAAGGISEIVVDRTYGDLVPVGDATALGDAIASRLATVRANPAERDTIATAARQRAAEFSITRTAERTAAVYERALRARRE